VVFDARLGFDARTHVHDVRTKEIQRLSHSLRGETPSEHHRVSRQASSGFAGDSMIQRHAGSAKGVLDPGFYHNGV